MGEVRDLWHWTPVTDTQKAHLEALAPDRRLGRAAALEYLERHTPDVIRCRPPILLPIGLMLIVIALLGITAGFMR